MPRTVPWYSAEGRVYHNNTDCLEGQRIELRHLRRNSDFRPLCDSCALLNAGEQRALESGSIDSTRHYTV
jgi:hypothetical protein